MQGQPQGEDAILPQRQLWERTPGRSCMGARGLGKGPAPKLGWEWKAVQGHRLFPADGRFLRVGVGGEPCGRTSRTAFGCVFHPVVLKLRSP